MEDNEAAGGEVMLNKWDPLQALVKCQWNGVKPLAKLSTATWGERSFIEAASSEHLCLSRWRNPIHLFERRLPAPRAGPQLLMLMPAKQTRHEGQRWHVSDGTCSGWEASTWNGGIRPPTCLRNRLRRSSVVISFSLKDFFTCEQLLAVISSDDVAVLKSWF